MGSEFNLRLPVLQRHHSPPHPLDNSQAREEMELRIPSEGQLHSGKPMLVTLHPIIMRMIL